MSHLVTLIKGQYRHVDEYTQGNTYADEIDAGAHEGKFRHVDEYRVAKIHYDADLESDSEIEAP